MLSQNFGRSYLYQIKLILRLREQYLIALQRCITAPIGPHLTPTFKGIMVRSQIGNLILILSLIIIDANQVISGNFKHLPFKAFLMVPQKPSLMFFFPSNQGFEHSQLLHKCNSQSGNGLGSHWASSLAFPLVYLCITNGVF